MVQPPYAWPSCDPEDENKAAAIAQILSASFNQSGTKIKHADEAILSAARHIVRSERITVKLKV